MPASESQLTYEDVFRDFVQRSLDEEKKRGPVPPRGEPEPQPDPAGAAADAAVGDDDDGDGGGAAPDAGQKSAELAGQTPERGRRRVGRPRKQGFHLGRGVTRTRQLGVKSGGDGDGGGTSASEQEGAADGEPAAKRGRGRGRGRPRGRGVTRADLDSGSSSHTESTADAELNQDSHGPGADEEGGRRRSSRRSRARSIDFKQLLDENEDEEEDPAAGSDAVEGRGVGAESAGDESGDDWRPPANTARSAASSEDESEAAPAQVPARRGRGRPPGGSGRGRGRGRGRGLITRYKLPEEVALKVNTPPPPTDVTPMAGHSGNLKTGDFLISLDDVNLDRPPIWRIDGKFLIQKYEPIKGKGQRLYKNMATYMSWSSNADKFRPVSVRYHQMGRTEIIVELLDNPHSSTFNLSKSLSIEATSKYLENFEIYMQTLISQALDANFLIEITQEGDEYFMKNVTIVQETNLARKNKILELKSWNAKTQEELDTLPVLELVLLRNVPPSECAVCHQTANARMVQLYGRPYDRATLQTLETSGPTSRRQHNMCSFCAGLADLYNKVEHLTYHLYLRCCEKVASRRKESPDDDSTRILNDILADEAWLLKAFSDVQIIWGDVDQIYTAAKEEEEEDEKNGDAAASSAPAPAADAAGSAPAAAASTSTPAAAGSGSS